MDRRQPSILIVDDEENIRFVLQQALRKEGYALETAVNGRDALRKLRQKPYDLLLLDLQMEPVGGLELFRAARELDENLVVIILTAYGSLDSAIEALRLGAFDYLIKPASPDLIRSRVRDGVTHRFNKEREQQLRWQIAALRQTLTELETDNLPPVDGRFLQTGPLFIDRYRQTASLDGRILELTTTEYNLLLCLAQNAPQPAPPQTLLNCALGYDAPPQEARELIKWHIHQLRRKIEPNPAAPRYIKTVRYKGYLWSG